MPSTLFWSREENKVFETALVEFSEEIPNRWHRIAEILPGKTPDDVEKHYIKLDQDLRNIELGLVKLPDYPEDHLYDNCFEILKNRDSEPQYHQPKSKNGESERKKGTPWTKEEHELFLLGLEKYGKGDWRSISRNIVQTRTPTQVASHAQKFFLRQQSGGKKERKRSSIHDITKVDTEVVDMRPISMPTEQLWGNPQQHLNHLQGQGGGHHPSLGVYDYENYGSRQSKNQNLYI